MNLDWLFDDPKQLKKQKLPRRNQPCPCGSGLKFKQCHMFQAKQNLIDISLNEKDKKEFEEEQEEKGIVKLS